MVTALTSLGPYEGKLLDIWGSQPRSPEGVKGEAAPWRGIPTLPPGEQGVEGTCYQMVYVCTCVSACMCKSHRRQIGVIPFPQFFQ